MIRRFLAILALTAAMVVGTASAASAGRLCLVVDWWFSDNSSRMCVPTLGAE